MNPPCSPEAWVRAVRFAAEAHAGQLVPGTALPYLVHLVSVAGEVLASIAPEPTERSELAVLCALLHDTVEDTPTSPEALAEAFGPEVAAGVLALTKDPSLPPERRMADSVERILRQPPEIARVKLADRISNLAEPPARWTGSKCRAYREEAELLLARLGPASPALAAKLAARIAAWRAHESRPG